MAELCYINTSLSSDLVAIVTGKEYDRRMCNPCAHGFLMDNLT